jgi:DNA-binding MltR family transcriptional regulator
MSEADRGCILLGVSMLDEQLKIFFEKMLPHETSVKKRKELFDGRGPFGTLSSKLNIAHVCQLLPVNIIESIHKLRSLRNDLAHQIAPFSIKENLKLIFEVFSLLTENLAYGLVQISGDFIYEQFYEKLMEADHPMEEGKKLFETLEQAYSHVENNPDLIEILTEKRIKIVFVVGISVLASHIIFYREKAISRLNQTA